MTLRSRFQHIHVFDIKFVTYESAAVTVYKQALDLIELVNGTAHILWMSGFFMESPDSRVVSVQGVCSPVVNKQCH